MIVEQYGLRYIRVREEDIEVLRYWRNQEYIRNVMQFKGYITPQMQKAWFHKINNKYNYFFIIEDNKKKIGLINCKDTIPNTKIAEGGIFIWDKSYWGTMIPVFASLTMLQAVFDYFKSGEESIVTVSKNNKTALDFNIMLGYEINQVESNDEFFKLHLSKEKYNLYCKKLIRAATIYNKGNSAFILKAEPSDLLIDEINNYIIKNSISL